MFNLREHFKLTGIYTFFAAFPALLQLIVYPIIEGKNRLGAEDFGYLAIAEAIITAATIFITFGSALGVSRFYWDYKDDKNRLGTFVSSTINSIVFRTLILLGIVFIAGSFIGKLFPHEALQQFEVYGPFLIIAAMSRSLTSVSTVLYRNEKNLSYFIIVSLCYGLFRSLFQIVGVLYLDLSFIGYIYGTAIGGGLVSIVVFILIFRKSGLHFRRNKNREFRTFSIPLFLNDLIAWGILYIDRFFLIQNPVNLGIYDNAMKFAFGVHLIVQGLAAAVQPELFGYLNEGIEKTGQQIKKISHLFILETISVVTIFIIPLMLFIYMFFETDLIASAGLITIIVVKYIFIAQYDLFSWVIVFFKKTRVLFLGNLIVFGLTILLNWILIPYIGFYGSITAFLFAYTVQATIFYFIQKKMLSIQWNKIKVLGFPLSIILFTAIAEFLKVYFQLDIFLTAFAVMLFISSGVIFLYHKELKSLVEKAKSIIFIRNK
jgi:O-antigen/teichoic acid export membrane protein